MEITANGENQDNTCPPSSLDIFSHENITSCQEYVLRIQRRLDKAVANDDRPKIFNIFPLLISSFMTRKAVCGESRTHGLEWGKDL